MHEIVKLAGGLAWPVGLIVLFLLPPLGLTILFFAIVLTILSTSWTRQRRHNELVQAASPPMRSPTIASDPPVAPELTTPSKDAQARLADIDELKTSGAISEDEYIQLRRRILDEV